MSEHRYGVHDCPNGLYYLRDVTDHSVYVHRNYGKLYSDYKDDIELVSTLLNELADKVDERQATIDKLKEENEQLRQFINKGRRLSVKELMDNVNENESLKEKIKGLEKENEKMKKRLSLYEMDEDEVDKYLRTHPMPTTASKRTVIPLDMRHGWY